MTADIPKTTMRVGTFKFVRFAEIIVYERRGWMVVAPLSGPHGNWSVLMWRCDCGVAT